MKKKPSRIRVDEVCVACGETGLLRLDVETCGSMRSDGLVSSESLQKYHCHQCGMLVGRNRQSPERYRRSNGESPFERARHQRVAHGIAELFYSLEIESNADVLEVGAASFQTSINLKKLAPALRVSALERHPEGSELIPGVDVIVSDFDDWVPDRQYRVCFSNDVIEHNQDPIIFLGRCRAAVSASGFVIVCCPNSAVANKELLFSDHLFTFTEDSIRRCGELAGLEMVSRKVASWDSLTDIYIFIPSYAQRKGGGGGRLRVDYSALYTARCDFLRGWVEENKREVHRNLDESAELVIYGAGEFSQLIRAYLPRIWDKVSHLAVDGLAGCRDFEKKVIQLDSLKLTNQRFLLGADASSRPLMKKKLVARGVREENIISTLV
jgi:hypothetical protein